ncbi:MAG: HlyD family secretion protein [Alphaproteobacteria bacterium]|nr:HlyD family secretion protein [Alphaproteobacteria bacterium]MBU0794655.1 HlyD family secretion protein [Alphaproteobacteria bacterium]MBU0877442.1 HlyD family secretion protein [Alphaproteobacteria bacterium]MBU1770309.1 HlyD family secretion protein [Alphaproteobacteria bacterium]
MSEADPALRPSAQAPATPVETATPPEPRGSQLRKRLLMFSVPLVVLVAGIWFWATSGRTVSTDNAYVKQDIVAVGSDVAGRIIEVRVRENQMVKAGDVLFVVDQQPYRVALQQADAQIANAQVEVGQLRSDFQATNVDIAGAREDVYYAQEDLKRQQALMKEGFTTRARLQQSEQALDNARTRLRTAEAEAAKAKAALASGPQVPGINPEIAAAQAQREQAALNLERTVVRAPTSGRISQATRLQVGQMAVQGLPLVSIVASDQVWITANFKETDLDRMRAGQSAEIELDAYPGTRIAGHVDSIGAGTGSEFSVLPAQNANGNWVKVTQRVPVRIAIDSRPERPMIAGLSANVTVDIRESKTPPTVASAR